MVQTNQLPAGTLLNGRYKIDVMLGKGGAGAVYKALDLQTNEMVAVKLLLLSEDNGEESMTMQRFQREVGLLQRVSHPNIIRVLDSGIGEGEQPFLVMEFVEGVTLKDVMRAGDMTLQRAARILRQIGGAIQAIHDQGIIHRDFKPQNVLVAGSGEQEQAKLLDFGIAKMIRGGTDEAFLRTLTAKGVIAGTLQYMSPEQCQGRKLDERTDIYSMGITAYEMVNGSLPFYSSNPVGLIMLHLETAPPPLKQVSKRVEAVIFKALEKLPESRFARAVDFAQAFEEAVAGVEQPAGAGQIPVDSGTSTSDETRAFAPDMDETPTLQSNIGGRAEHEKTKVGLWASLGRKLGLKK